MTTLHEQAESYRALDHRLREIVEATAARDTFHALLGGELLSLHVGWPILSASATPRAQIAIELTAGTESALELLVPHESAARWVDRALGGNGDSGLAGASGVLSEGECGVLAYLASRVCRNFDPFQVCDVRPATALAERVLWPLSFETALGRSALQCAIVPWRAESLPDRHRLTVSVFDRAPAAFHAGEVWISDRWNLSSTSDGLAGEVQLAVDGCASQLAAIVGRGQLRAHGPSSQRDQVEVVLASRSVSFMELARIGAGEALPIDLQGPVELRREGQRALGELISWRGAVGVRIHEA